MFYTISNCATSLDHLKMHLNCVHLKSVPHQKESKTFECILIAYRGFSLFWAWLKQKGNAFHSKSLRVHNEPAVYYVRHREFVLKVLYMCDKFCSFFKKKSNSTCWAMQASSKHRVWTVFEWFTKKCCKFLNVMILCVFFFQWKKLPDFCSNDKI